VVISGNRVVASGEGLAGNALASQHSSSWLNVRREVGYSHPPCVKDCFTRPGGVGGEKWVAHVRVVLQTRNTVWTVNISHTIRVDSTCKVSTGGGVKSLAAQMSRKRVAKGRQLSSALGASRQ